MNTTKNITINGIGIALFVVLSLCLQVPVFENYYLCLGYVIMAIYCYSVGTISGTLVGTLGTILYCVLINGFRGMPGWALGNVVIGLIIGYAFKLAKSMNHTILEIIISVIGICIATVLGIGIMKSGVECVLYAQPFLVRMTSNGAACIADLIMLIVSLPICKMLDPHITKLSR